jgi:hypothetical protein
LEVSGNAHILYRRYHLARKAYCSYYSAIAAAPVLVQAHFVACTQAEAVGLEAAHRLEQAAKVYIPAVAHNFAALAA